MAAAVFAKIQNTNTKYKIQHPAKRQKRATPTLQSPLTLECRMQNAEYRPAGGDNYDRVKKGTKQNAECRMQIGANAPSRADTVHRAMIQPTRRGGLEIKSRTKNTKYRIQTFAKPNRQDRFLQYRMQHTKYTIQTFAKHTWLRSGSKMQKTKYKIQTTNLCQNQEARGGI